MTGKVEILDYQDRHLGIVELVEVEIPQWAFDHNPDWFTVVTLRPGQMAPEPKPIRDKIEQGFELIEKIWRSDNISWRFLMIRRVAGYREFMERHKEAAGS